MRIPYRETIRKTAEAQGRHKKQTGGAGQFGDCWLRIEPNPGAGYEFVDEIVGGKIPRGYLPAIDKGVQDAMREGFLAGYPMEDIKCAVYDGSYHSVDSNEMAFKIAASMATKQLAQKGGGKVLEPIMKVEIVTPEDYLGDVMGDVSRRRGVLQGQDDSPSGKIINAMIPLGEMFGYATDVRSMSQGRASYSMEFSKYAEAPSNIVEALVKKQG